MLQYTNHNKHSSHKEYLLHSHYCHFEQLAMEHEQFYAEQLDSTLLMCKICTNSFTGTGHEKFCWRTVSSKPSTI